VIVAPQAPVVSEVVEREAERLSAPLFAANRDWIARGRAAGWCSRTATGLLDLPAPHLPGRHQFTNAGTAIAALRVAKLGIGAAAIETGLATVDWPARLQRLTSGPLLAHLPAGSELWLTAATTPAPASSSQKRWPTSRTARRGRSCWWLDAQHQGPSGVLRAVCRPRPPCLHRAGPGSEASRDARDLADAARSAGLPAEPSEDFVAALDAIRVQPSEGGRRAC